MVYWHLIRGYPVRKFLIILSCSVLSVSANAARWTIDTLYSEAYLGEGYFEYTAANGYSSFEYFAGIGPRWTLADIVDSSETHVVARVTPDFLPEPFWLSLAWEQPLNSADPIQIDEQNSFFHSGYTLPDCNSTDSCRYISGHISEVPLPAAAWLFLAAIGGLGIVKRFEKHKFAQ